MLDPKFVAELMISIHAAREGGDGVSRCIFLLPDNFNPRRP